MSSAFHARRIATHDEHAVQTSSVFQGDDLGRRRDETVEDLCAADRGGWRIEQNHAMSNEHVGGDAESEPMQRPAPIRPELVVVSGPGAETPEAAPADVPEAETVSEPGKVMRIGSMIKQLLEEVRQAPLDERSRVRLREVYEISVRELSGSLSPDLRDELVGLALPFADDAVPSESELRIAQAQLVGWLEGLFHGIQATLFAQQMAAQAQLQQMQQMRQRGLPSGMAAGFTAQETPDGAGQAGPLPGGTYL